MKKRLEIKSGEAFPIQYREFKVDKSKIDKDARTVEILFSTDAPADRWWGKEILDHSPGACDLSRLNDGGAFLKDHDPTQQIGVHESASISLTQRDGKSMGEGRAVVRFAPPTNPLAEQEFQDMLAGVRTKISVGYITHAMELVAEDDDEGDTWLVTEWEPLENSLVSIPLDKSCAVGRDGVSDKYPVVLKKKIETDIDETDELKQKREAAKIAAEKNQTMTTLTPEEQKAADLKAKQEREAQLKADREAERTRIREINAIAKRANVPAEVLEKAIDDGDEVESFRKLVFEKYWGNPQPLQTPGENDRGSSSNGGRQLMRPLTPGQLFVQDERFIDVSKRGKLNRGGVVGVEAPGATHFRTTLISGAGNGANLASFQELTDVITVLQQRLTIADLLGQGETSSQIIRYPQQINYANTTAVTAEGTTKPEVTFDFQNATAPVVKIAGWTKISDEVIQDFPFLRAVIDTQLPFMVQQTEEHELLYGDGTGVHLLGLLNQTNIQTQVRGGDTGPDAIYKGITKIRTVAFLEPDGIVMHPIDWQGMKLSKDGNGQYYAGGPFMGAYGQALMVVDRIWGLPVVITVAITQGTALIGAFKIATMIARRTGLVVEMTNTDQDDFIKNLLTMRAEERLALLVWRPQGLCEVTL